MSRTIPVIFDGEVFRPVEPVDLPAGCEYQVVVEDRSVDANGEQRNRSVQHATPQGATTPASSEESASDDDGGEMPEAIRRILARARPLDLPTDFAAQHDHYLYGTPKR